MLYHLLLITNASVIIKNQRGRLIVESSQVHLSIRLSNTIILVDNF